MVDLDPATAWIWDAIVLTTSFQHWPDGDPGQLRALGEKWSELSEVLTSAFQEMDQDALSVAQNWGGSAGTAFAQRWQHFRTQDAGGPSAFITAASEYGVATQNAAMELEFAQLMCQIIVVITAAEVILGLAFPEFGGTAFAASAILMARASVTTLLERLSVQMAKQIVKKAMEEAAELAGRQGAITVLKSAGWAGMRGAVTFAGADVAAQGYQLAEGHRDTFDGGMAARDLAGGAVGGFTGHLTAGGFQVLTRGMMRPLTRDGANGLVKFLAGSANAAVSTGLANVTSVPAMAITQSLMQGGFKGAGEYLNSWSPAEAGDEFLKGMLGGGVRHVVQSGGRQLIGTHLDSALSRTATFSAVRDLRTSMMSSEHVLVLTDLTQAQTRLSGFRELQADALSRAESLPAGEARAQAITQAEDFGVSADRAGRDITALSARAEAYAPQVESAQHPLRWSAKPPDVATLDPAARAAMPDSVAVQMDSIREAHARSIHSDTMTSLSDFTTREVRADEAAARVGDGLTGADLGVSSLHSSTWHDVADGQRTQVSRTLDAALARPDLPASVRSDLTQMQEHYQAADGAHGAAAGHARAADALLDSSKVHAAQGDTGPANQHVEQAAEQAREADRQRIAADQSLQKAGQLIEAYAPPVAVHPPSTVAGGHPVADAGRPGTVPGPRAEPGPRHSALADRVLAEDAGPDGNGGPPPGGEPVHREPVHGEPARPESRATDDPVFVADHPEIIRMNDRLESAFSRDDLGSAVDAAHDLSAAVRADASVSAADRRAMDPLDSVVLAERPVVADPQTGRVPLRDQALIVAKVDEVLGATVAGHVSDVLSRVVAKTPEAAEAAGVRLDDGMRSWLADPGMKGGFDRESGSVFVALDRPLSAVAATVVHESMHVLIPDEAKVREFVDRAAQRDPVLGAVGRLDAIARDTHERAMLSGEAQANAVQEHFLRGLADFQPSGPADRRIPAEYRSMAGMDSRSRLDGRAGGRAAGSHPLDAVEQAERAITGDSEGLGLTGARDLGPFEATAVQEQQHSETGSGDGSVSDLRQGGGNGPGDGWPGGLRDEGSHPGNRPSLERDPTQAASGQQVAERRRDSALDPRREAQAASPPAGGDDKRIGSHRGMESSSGSQIRPRDALDIDQQGAWAGHAYESFRASDSDVAGIASHLSGVTRPDGSTGFAQAEIRQIKDHLFRTNHLIEEFDDNRIVVGHRRSRFDVDADIAEAWIRMGKGRHLPEDIVLLEHELAESRYELVNADTTYQQAHAKANEQFAWEQRIPDRTGEDLDVWRREYGDLSVVREAPRDGSGSSVQLRLSGDEPPTEGRQGVGSLDSGGRSGGLRDESGDPGDRRSDAGGADLAEGRRGSALDDASPDGTVRPTDATASQRPADSPPEVRRTSITEALTGSDQHVPSDGPHTSADEQGPHAPAAHESRALETEPGLPRSEFADGHTVFERSMERLSSGHPAVTAMVTALRDHGHKLNVIGDLNDPERRATTARHLADLADGATLGSMPLERVLLRYPSRGLLFERIEDTVNLTHDKLSRKQAFIDAAKATDPVRVLGTDPRHEFDPRVREYVDKLQAVKQAADRDLRAMLDGIDDAALNSRTKTSAGLVDKVLRMTSGAQGRAARPDYRIGDVIDAVGARITVPDTAALERIYQRVKDELGTGDGGRILELENMYAAPKSHAPAYRLLAMIVRVDIGGESFSYELQLTTQRASIAADMNHNTLYKPIEPVSPEQASLIQRMMDEAAAADQVDFVRSYFEPGRDLGPLGDDFRAGIFELEGKKKLSLDERSVAEWLLQHLDGQAAIHQREKIDDSEKRLKNPDLVLRTSPDGHGERFEIKTLATAELQVSTVRKDIANARAQVDAFGGGGVVIDGRKVGLTKGMAEESYLRESGSVIGRGGLMPKPAIFILGDGSSLIFGGFGVG